MAKKKEKKQKKWVLFPKMLNSMKRLFSRSPTAAEMYTKHRIEIDVFNKDGKKSQKIGVRFTCNHCKQLFQRTDTQVDHVDSIVPLSIPGKFMMTDIIIDRIFCDIKNLQILCKPCHKVKSLAENKERREWLKREKHGIYLIINTVTQKRYMGIHTTFDLDDGFMGNDLKLQQDINKYGVQNFKKYYLHVFKTKAEAKLKLKELTEDEK